MIIIKVCAYCRVSTDKCDQVNSLDAQVRYFTEYINMHVGWELAGVFSDEGLSGTSTGKRAAFNEMIERCILGEIDTVITKEVSRFARNTVDALYYTRLLSEHNVGVIFISDGIDTRSGDGEFRLAIMASVAQEESRKTSERVKWGQKRAMERGVIFGNGNIFGYDLTDGIFRENEEAHIVREIFELCISGMSTRKIAEYLNERCVPSKTGKRWSGATIHRIITNEKYCGDLLQSKQITVNYLSHKRNINKGDKILIRNHHTPLVSRRVWQRANKELKKRQKKGK